MLERFAAVSRKTAEVAGSWWAFLAALGVILVWAATGPLFGFSDTWQLIINTGTTIVTFLMVFLIQGATNRSERSIHVKLDEIICALDKASNAVIDIEHASDKDIQAARERVAQQKGQA